MSRQVGVPFLGAIPLDADIFESGDEGRPIVLEKPNSVATKAYLAIATELAGRLQHASSPAVKPFALTWDSGEGEPAWVESAVLPSGSRTTAIGAQSGAGDCRHRGHDGPRGRRKTLLPTHGLGDVDGKARRSVTRRRGASMLVHATIILFLISSLSRSSGATELAEIDAYVAGKMGDHLIPGLALAVIRNGAVIHHRGFGEMTASRSIVIGSLSKALTATAVLQLVDARKVELDAPVRRYLADFDLADPAGGAITVRQLLNQTSGIPTDAARADRLEASLADHVAALREVRLVAPPGTHYVYASPNYQVLGRLVEVVSGEPFGAYVQRHVFEPLKMTSSSADLGAARDLAPGHNVWWGLNGPTPYHWEAGRLPTASLISSADDLARFVLAHLNGGELDGARILSEEAVETAHRGVGKSEGFTYAMGWRQGTTAGMPSLWHGGALACYRGAVVMLPKTRSGVVVLANSSSMFADHTREIAAGVVALMNGRPSPVGIRPLRRTYLFIAAGSAVLLGFQVRGLWRAAVGERLARGRRTLPIVAFNLLLPVALIALIPRMAHVSWIGMFEGAPDLVVTSSLLLLFSVVGGLIKLARRSHRGSEIVRPGRGDWPTDHVRSGVQAKESSTWRSFIRWWGR